jgi:hypothetical protein
VLTLRFTLTKPEYLALCRRICARRWQAWLIPVASGSVAVGVGVWRSDGVLVAIGAALAICWAVYVFFVAPRICWRKLPQVRGEQTLTFSESGVTAVMVDATSTTTWEFWRDVAQLGDVYLMRSKRGGLTVIPQRSFGSADEQRQFIKLVSNAGLRAPA